MDIKDFNIGYMPKIKYASWGGQKSSSKKDWGIDTPQGNLEYGSKWLAPKNLLAERRHWNDRFKGILKRRSVAIRGVGDFLPERNKETVLQEWETAWEEYQVWYENFCAGYEDMVNEHIAKYQNISRNDYPDLDKIKEKMQIDWSMPAILVPKSGKAETERDERDAAMMRSATDELLLSKLKDAIGIVQRALGKAGEGKKLTPACRESTIDKLNEMKGLNWHENTTIDQFIGDMETTLSTVGKTTEDVLTELAALQQSISEELGEEFTKKLTKQMDEILDDIQEEVESKEAVKSAPKISALAF